jgi:peptidoglycan-associated lipoprotein
MQPNTPLLYAACLGALLLALGCASNSTPSSPPQKPSDPPPVARTTPTPGAELALTEPGAPELSPIYFDTDRSLLRAEARATLKRYADLIQQHPEWGTVTIAGHCDERGSEEYNVALGGRRAAAVVEYLTDLGVPAERLATRTFGEALPVAEGHHEAAWRQNRRAELQSEAHDSARR